MILCYSLSGVLFGTTMVMVSIALVMAVIVTNLYLRKDSDQRVPYPIRRLFLGRSKVRKNSIPPTPKIMLNNDQHLNHDGKLHNDVEIDNISNLSEMEGLTCRGERCFKRKSTIYRSAQEQDTSALISYEWQKLAKCVDRICFWLFFVSSIAALSAMFCSIPTAFNGGI